MFLSLFGLYYNNYISVHFVYGQIAPKTTLAEIRPLAAPRVRNSKTTRRRRRKPRRRKRRRERRRTSLKRRRKRARRRDLDC